MGKIKFAISILLLLFFGLNDSFSQSTEDVKIDEKDIKKGTYTSTTKINSKGKVKKGTEGVVFKATEGIIFKPGFSAEAGADLTAKVEEISEKGFLHTINVFPNPFKFSTTIYYSLPKKEKANLSIYDSDDKLVKQLLNRSKEKGEHEFDLEASSFSSGVYKVVLKTENAILVQKMIVIQ